MQIIIMFVKLLDFLRVFIVEELGDREIGNEGNGFILDFC